MSAPTVPKAPLDESSLRQTVLEYQAILENATLGITFTRDRIFLHCNERFGELFGWPNHELIGKPASIVYPSPEAYAEMGRIATPVLASGARLDIDVLMKRRDGTVFWCRTMAKAIDPADHSKGTIFIVEDITERKQADAKLHQLLAEYQSILDNASLGITFTCDRKFRHCNARFSEMFGWPAQELIGQPTDIVYPSAEAFAEMGRIAGPVLARGERLETEVLMKRRDASTFWCRVLAKPIDQADNSKGTIFIVEDITERRRVQEALKRAHDELELRVEERTAELAAANLRLQAEVREREAAEQKVRELANHDALTGLPNRRLLEDRLEQALRKARRSRNQVSLQFIDLDRFKHVNDTLGHRVGDLLLQAVARRLCSLLREVDTVSRIGGDEFVVVLPDLESSAVACDVAKRMLEALAQPYAIEGHEVVATPSIGISMYPEHGDHAEELLVHADQAMYEAKQAGRKTCRLYAAPKKNKARAKKDPGSAL
jgi:diguanylate cyclase (GGDEF)-like protein/PAS domain S-box-containing protein